MSLLRDLMVKYGTDKHIWGYDPVYTSYLEARRYEVRCVLEIGICGNRDIPNNIVGASLHVWRDFFPNAYIFGIDNDPRWMVNLDRIRSFCIDAYNSSALHDALSQTPGGFDFICDDAVHDPLPQVALAADLEPYLRDRGVYAIEDVCPYKLVDGNMTQMLRFIPKRLTTHVYETGKPERLIIGAVC